MALFTGSRAKPSRWHLPISQGANCTKARWENPQMTLTRKSPPQRLFFCLFWPQLRSLWCWPGASGDPAAKSNQRLEETFDHLHAQLNHRKHKSYRGPGKTYSTVPKTRGVKSRGQKSAQKCNGGNLSNSGKASASCWSLEFKFWCWRGSSWAAGSKLYLHTGLARPTYHSWASLFTTIWFFLLSKKILLRFRFMRNSKVHV